MRSATLFKRDIFARFHDACIGRADDLVHIDKLLQPVGAPADDARDGEDRGVKLERDVQHVVDKAGIEVDVGGNALVDVTFFGNDLRGQALDHVVEIEIRLAVLGFGQLLDVALEDDGGGAGRRGGLHDHKRPASA